MAQTTKKALAASLKKLLSAKPLDKITISDITQDCEVNRQTFYYHFKDIYDLIEWIYTSEASRAIGEKKTYDTWQQGFLQIFEYARQNKAFIINTYHSVSREHLENYLYNATYELLYAVIDELCKDINVRDQDKAFVAHFYKYGFVGLILEWIDQGMKKTPETIVNRLNILMEGNIPAALERFKTY